MHVGDEQVNSRLIMHIDQSTIKLAASARRHSFKPLSVAAYALYCTTTYTVTVMAS